MECVERRSRDHTITQARSHPAKPKRHANRLIALPAELVGVPRYPEEVTGARVGALHSVDLAVARNRATGVRLAIRQLRQPLSEQGVAVACPGGRAALFHQDAIAPTAQVTVGRSGRTHLVVFGNFADDALPVVAS